MWALRGAGSVTLRTRLCVTQNIFRGAKGLTVENMNPCVKEMEYAVRGPIVQRAGQIQDELNCGVQKPFAEVVRANIGDCHATGQKPLTFIRQVLALCTYPALLNDSQFPSDTKARATRILDDCGGNSMGAYTESGGMRVVRQDTADYITARDGGFRSKWQNINLSTGASEAIKSILEILNISGPNGEPTGVMVPIPQYPLYSATLTEYNMRQVGYFLDEANNWSLSSQELGRSLNVAKGKLKFNVKILLSLMLTLLLVPLTACHWVPLTACHW